MADVKREVWVIEDEDGYIVRPCLIKAAAEREAVSAAGERVVRYVPEHRIRALEAGLAEMRKRADSWERMCRRVAEMGGVAMRICTTPETLFPEGPEPERRPIPCANQVCSAAVENVGDFCPRCEPERRDEEK